jgi:hypothetical protein
MTWIMYQRDAEGRIISVFLAEEDDEPTTDPADLPEDWAPDQPTQEVP